MLARVRVIARNAGGKRRFVVVTGSDAFGILGIDLAIAVVVNAIAARKNRPVARGLIRAVPPIRWAAVERPLAQVGGTRPVHVASGSTVGLVVGTRTAKQGDQHCERKMGDLHAPIRSYW